MKTPISALLHGKSFTLRWVAPTATVQEAVAMMDTHKIGSVVVLDGGRLAGLFTERDVLSSIVARGLDPRTVTVAAVMTPNPPTITPDTLLEEAMALISEKRVRQLPVVEGDRVTRLVSIGDINKWVVDHLRFETETLRSYVAGGYPG
jgi:CBS domain-containing protein